MTSRPTRPPTTTCIPDDPAGTLVEILRAATSHSIVVLGLDGTILLWGEGARRAYGYEPEEIEGLANVSMLHDPGRDPPELAAAARDGRWEGVLQRRHKNGDRTAAHVVITPRRDASDRLRGFVMIAYDAPSETDLVRKLRAERAARVLAEAALHESDARYRHVAGTVSDAILAVDARGVIRSANAAAETIFGHRVSDVLGRKLSMLIPGSLRRLRPALAKSAPWQATGIAGVRRDGRRIVLSVDFQTGSRSDAGHIVGVVRELPDWKRADRRLRHLAQHDPLTGLSNRALLEDRIQHALTHARRRHHKVAVLFLDLDNFKHVNDSLGHQAGDLVLRLAARRLQGSLREGDSIGRMGGDEFVVALPMLVEERDAAIVAEKILEALRIPFEIDDHELHIGASIGISLFPADGNDADSLLRAADTAMYHAKENGRNTYRCFTPGLNEAARRRLTMTTRLHRALDRGEFTLVYQPQVELQSGRIFAVEALLRWKQAGDEILPPGEFVRYAEDAGLIVPIGEWVLRRACRQLSRWRLVDPDLRVAVNLSPEQIRHPGFADLVLRALRDTGLPATALDLEITESVFMQQNRENIANLTRLAGNGVQFAVDDFGTGYSSLAYLQRFPIDTIKIDRVFVHGLGQDRNNGAIVAAILAMARNLNLHIVAEGVETPVQAAFLAAHGCLAAQGFYYHAPMPPETFQKLIGDRAAGPAPDHSFADVGG